MPIIARNQDGNDITVLAGKLYEWYRNENGKMALRPVSDDTAPLDQS